ncbi:MAG: T9SS type A sorting domain-containing protein, partial [Candidatus Kapaibacterium sp.]
AELSSDKYAEMGITKRHDGTVSFIQKSGSGNIFTMSFPANSWGIIMNDDDDSTNMVPNPPSFAPLIVTDTKGNKRMMQFTDNSNGNKLRSLEIHSHSDGQGPQNALEIKKLVQIGGDDGDIDQLNVGLDSNDIKEMNEEIRTQMNDQKNEADENPASTSQNQVHVFAKFNSHKSDSTSGGKQHGIITINKTICMDSTIHSLKNINMDSIMKEVRKSMKDVRIQLKNMNLDSIYKASYESLKHAEIQLKSLNMDSMMKEAHKSLKKADDELKRMNLDSVLKSATESMIEAEDVMAKRCSELNSLVPILVRKSTKDHYNSKEDITYDDGLIFWYDNSQAFAKAAPYVVTNYIVSRGPVSNGNVSNSDVNNQGVVANPDFNGKEVVTATDLTNVNVISRSLIYPNPARNATTVRFDLSEPRTVAFSIHDLLGKRVLEAGNLTVTSPGSYEKELNIGELAAGVYLLVITTEKGEQSMQRLVVEK